MKESNAAQNELLYVLQCKCFLYNISLSLLFADLCIKEISPRVLMRIRSMCRLKKHHSCIRPNGLMNSPLFKISVTTI